MHVSIPKVARTGAFIGGLGLAAVLVGSLASGTGAYFTDVHQGATNVSTGTVKVNTTDTTLNFLNLLPGEYQTKTVDYNAAGTGSEDIWLVIDPSTSANNYATEAFVGAPDDGHGGGLGRYGHVEVSSTDGANFISSNLSSPRAGAAPSESCSVDANGHGGNAATVNSGSALLPYCPVPNAILLSSGKTAGQGGTVSLTFGYTGLLSGGQGQGPAPLVPFKIVATQHGISPLS